jgi:hypothetical protein
MKTMIRMDQFYNLEVKKAKKLFKIMGISVKDDFDFNFKYKHDSYFLTDIGRINISEMIDKMDEFLLSIHIPNGGNERCRIYLKDESLKVVDIEDETLFDVVWKVFQHIYLD